jgi:glutathione S-transferase
MFQPVPPHSLTGQCGTLQPLRGQDLVPAQVVVLGQAAVVDDLVADVLGQPLEALLQPRRLLAVPHIALHEAGLAFEAIPAPTKTHKLPDGTDYYTINPLGYVPLLELDDGTRLTEGPAIVQYIADQVPGKQLAPANGTLARYQLQSLADLHRHRTAQGLLASVQPGHARRVQGDGQGAAGRPSALGRRAARRQAFLMGDTFSVADGYLFTVTNWAPRVGVDLAGLSRLLAWRERIAARPAVQAAMKAEGLLG